MLKVALTDPAAREWLREQHWAPVLAESEDSALVQKVVFATMNVDDPASLTAFLSTLDPAEEAALIDILEGRKPEFAMMIANDCWRELERRQIRRRLEAVQARLRAPEQALETIVAAQKEILDLQKRLTDIARPFSPPL